MFDGLAGIDVSRYFLAIGVVGLGLLCLFGVLWVIRKKPSSPFVRGGRARQPRLAVVDATAVDARRRLVLVRRDNVEHLIMIGGPTDIVIESRISDEPTTKPAVTELPFEQQAALPKADTALELPAPALQVTEQPVSASVQTQSAPPLKAKLWPTEPKKNADPTINETTPAQSISEPLAFQPPLHTKMAPSFQTAERSPASDRVPASASVASTIAFASGQPAQKEPELEIRNPYLDAETAAPAPIRNERATTPAPAPVSAMHSWLRPVKTDTTTASPKSEPEIRASDKVVVLPPQPVAAKPATVEPVVNTPIDVDTLISSDFLDAARSRVLDLPSSVPAPSDAVSGVSEQSAMPSKVEPEKQEAITPAQSEFARILEDEIKMGLPENRFEQPRMDPFLADVANLGSTRSAPSVESTAVNESVTDTMDALQTKKITDILDGARARVLEPEPINQVPEVTIEAVMQPTADAPNTRQLDTGELISDAFALEFEKIWEKHALEADQAFVVDARSENTMNAPDVTLDGTQNRPLSDIDIFGSDVTLDLSLEPPSAKTSNRPIEPELSLDDEMERVLGEFSAMRKN